MTDNPWGRIAEDGSVFVKLPDGNEHKVGQWAAGDPEEGLQYYQRRYLDVVVEADLALKRIKGGQATPPQALAAAERLRAAVTDPSGVGDLAELAKKAEELEKQAGVRKEKLAEDKKAAKIEALEKRDALADEAEKLADSEQWKVTGQRYRDMLAEWKQIRRFDRKAEQERWDRFSKARSGFDKRRRVYFAKLDETRAEGARIRESIIRRAEGLASSTDWGTTTRAYRELMDEWKASPRANRKLDDDLWARFKAAQDQFFGARNALNAERDAGEKENLTKKKELLDRAEKLVPPKDLKVARAEFRKILDAWEDIGYVPRADKPKIEKRLRNVERQISTSEKEHWRKTDPAAKNRAESTVGSFNESLAKLEKQRAVAEKAGDAKKVEKIEASMESTKMLMAAAQGALDEYS